MENSNDKSQTRTVNDLLHHLDLKVAAGNTGLRRQVTDGYCGDLLSDVMAHAPRGCIWLTIQGHQNIVAVAVLRQVAAIIIAGSCPPEEETLQKADAEGIPIVLCPESTYQLAGRLYALGVGQRND